MGDDLTSEDRRELDAIDRALSGRPVDPEFEDVAALTNELREVRAAPRPEYARELDQRAARWLGSAEPRRRRLPRLRVALPAGATAAAVAVVAVAVIGGESGDDSALQLSAVQDERSGAMPLAAPKAESDDAHGEAERHSEEGAHPEEGAHQGPLVGRELELERRRVAAGQPIVVRYEVLRGTAATVQLGDEEGEMTLEPGRGRLEIGTGGVPPGEQPLSIILQPGGSLHTTVRIGG